MHVNYKMCVLFDPDITAFGCIWCFTSYLQHYRDHEEKFMHSFIQVTTATMCTQENQREP